MERKVLYAHLYMVLQTLIMAPSYVFGGNAAREFQPFLLIAMRAILSSALFLSLFFLTKGLKKQKLSKSDWKRILILAVFGIFINQSCFIVGLSLTSPAHVAMLYSLTPLIVFIIAVFAKYERFTKANAIFVTSAVVGTLLVLTSKESAVNAKNPILGNIITLIGVISWAIFLTYSKPMMRKLSPVQLTSIIMTIGAIGFSIVGAFFLPQMQWEKITFNAWFGFTYLVIVNSFLSYLLLTSALSKLSSAQVAIYINTQPIVATLITWFVGELVFQWQFFLGSILCIFAILGLTFYKK